MYKISGDPSKINVITASSEFLDSPEKINDLVSQYKIIRDYNEECKVDRSIIVRDLSLVVKASQEDEAFASDPFLWLNFRRGNTLLELYDPNDYKNLVKTVIARKGINKFFDIKYEYVSKEKRYREDILSEYETDVKNIILAGAKKAMLEGHKVEVVKTLKANGENCQISWNPDADAWIIASKNVALIARDT